MWATWCKNCLTMDKTTLQNGDVKAALAGYVKVKFQTEDLDALAQEGVAALRRRRLAHLRDPALEKARKFEEEVRS